MVESQERPKRRKLSDTFNYAEVPAQIEGIAKFKEFLQSIASPDNAPERPQRLKVLKSYCQEQAQSPTSNPACLRDLLSSWSFAIEVGQEPLLSAIPSVIALFLKTISFHLEFRELGVGLCQHLLEKDQLRLFDRGMTANRTKEHLISPCVRLLTEIVGFDGGSIASRVLANRNITFKRLDTFLEQRKPKSDEEQSSSGKPTLRRITQRYVLRNLVFQNAAMKRELISEGKLLRAFLHNIRSDAADIIVDILQAIDQHIIGEHSLSRSSKARFFDLQILQSLSTLYTFRLVGNDASVEPAIPQRVHTLLLKLCTDSGNGLLLRQSGWYPPGFDPNAPLGDEPSDKIDMGLNSLATINKTDESRPVTNLKLSRFLQSLHPESNTLQSELLLASFKAAPELVADYFSHKPSFLTEPKPTPDWLGQAAWLFRCVQLPLPEACGQVDGFLHHPPPLPIVLENVLPKPLDRATLTRCMNLNVEVVTLFAARVLVIAFQKLRDVITMFTGASTTSQLWSQAAASLRLQFGQRIPLVQDIIAAFQRNAKGARSLRASATEVIAWYYEMLPELVMSETFNISTALGDVLTRLLSERQNPSVEDDLAEVQTLMRIAVRLSHMKWWNKLEGQDLSCFTSILQAVAVADPHQARTKELKNNLHLVAQDHGILGDNVMHLNMLIASLRLPDLVPSLSSIFEFLDNCLTRLARALVHYQDLACEYFKQEGIADVPDLLVAAVIEQWPYVSKRKDLPTQEQIAKWIARLFGGLVKCGAIKHRLHRLETLLKACSEGNAARAVVEQAFKGDLIGLFEEESDHRPVTESQVLTSHARRDESTKILEENSLQDWRSKLSSQQILPPRRRLDLEDLEIIISDNHLKDNICLLCSQQEDVRLQSLDELSRFLHRLQSATNRNWRPLSVLVGEIIETAKDSNPGEAPLPSVLAQLGCKFIDVITDPSHLMYAKVNRFLNKGPVWEKKKCITYWIDRVILKDSEGGDSKLGEMIWLLGILVQGLRTME
ncbi:MAG: hypothetical protein Q9160_002310, partial [Pyrenula sp. 1 TL-2023]